ncbi:MAG: glycoside hydrolase family 43 protein [Cytophagales bacterium]|jgi:GH43 family beta-xylosidase|nr:glycoside hydrolase family 43 protein [Cytophagales bacterium]
MHQPLSSIVFKRFGVVLLLAISILFNSCRTNTDTPETTQLTFTNPLLASGPDPWITYQNGWYYYTHTLGSYVSVWKTKNPTDLRSAESKKVWDPSAGQPYSENVWAPEIHFVQGKWYIYVAADDGKNENHRIWVLENPSPDPLEGTWTLKGKLADPGDHWAIDMTVFEHKGQLYAAWSGWEGRENVSQNIYLAKLKNPWTMDGDRVKISSPEYAWEKRGSSATTPVINEGPQFLRQSPDSRKVFIVFSASGCWSDDYALGLLEADANADLMSAPAWKKSPNPVFQKAPANSIFGPGHNSFFKSPDGKEDWILYHANAQAGDGCGNKRAPHAQPFVWKADGTPDFGTPMPKQPMPVPAGI